MHGTFYFRPVGQGCFYTGAIGDDHEPWHRRFRFVYDCGSSTSKDAIETACTNFSDGCAGAPLDALVISHLDADHVNGLDALISLMSPTQRVFLPYLSPVERFLSALKFSSEDPSYYEFLSDPVYFLESRGVREVVFVTGGGNDDHPEEGNEPPANPDEPKTPPGKPPELSLLNAERDQLAAAEYAKDQSASKMTPFFMTHRKSILLPHLWRFRFFNRREIGVSLDTFAKCEAFLAGTPVTDEEKMMHGFLTQVKAVLGGFTVKKILDAITNERTRKELKSTYSRIQSAHNEVSLVLWHGPVLHGAQSCQTAIRGSLAVKNASLNHWINFRTDLWGRGGTMLTGDIAIKGDTATRFANHYRNELSQTGIFYMPHHGSGHNWVLNPALLINGTFCVASAGIHNSYGHPDPFLVDVRAVLHCPVFWSNENKVVESWVRF
jgi:hypothetical protein